MPLTPDFDGLPAPILEKLPALMRAAIARGRLGDNPFGCVLASLDDGRIVLEAANTTAADPTAHAEMNALRWAAERGIDPTSVALISTAEPCPMCMSASWWAKIPAIVFGTSNASLLEFGWAVVEIEAAEILRKGHGGNEMQLVGGYLAGETDSLYAGGPRRST